MECKASETPRLGNVGKRIDLTRMECKAVSKVMVDDTKNV